MLTGTLAILLLTPLHNRLVVHAQNEVGEQLEEALPQQERDIKGDAAYVQLAAVAGEGHVAEALEPAQ